MTTKLTDRDKKLLSMLGFFIVAALILLLAVFPLYSANAAMKTQIRDNTERIAQMQQKEMDLAAVQTANRQKKEELAQIQENMFPRMKSQDIDRLLTEKVVANHLSTRKLQILMPEEAANVAAYGKTEDDGSNPDKADGVWLAEVNLELSGDLPNMDVLIDEFTNTPGIRITNLDFSSKESTENGTAVRTDLLSMKLQIIMSGKE